MLKKSLLLAAALLTSAMSFAQTRYVVWSGDELTADETQIPGQYNPWWNVPGENEGVEVVDDAASVEGKSWKWAQVEAKGSCSGGYLTLMATAETVTPLASMDLVFNAKVEGTGTWSVRLTAANPESDCLVSVPADGEYHQVRMNVQKEFPRCRCQVGYMACSCRYVYICTCRCKSFGRCCYSCKRCSL